MAVAVRLMVACTAASSTMQATAAGPTPRRPPNVVIIMADDMGWSDIGCFGGEIETPSIDRIATEGMTFTQFYNNAKCTTTRASLLTGVYPRNGGKGEGQLLTAGVMTIAEVLRRSGYATGMSGKWHNGSSPGTLPHDRGFDESYGLWDGCCNYFDPARPDPAFKGGRVRIFGHNLESIDRFPNGFYTTDAFTDHAVATIRRHARQGKPFVHYVAYTAPHYPLHARPEEIAKYRGRFAAGWDVLREQRLARQRAMGLVDPRWVAAARDPEAGAWEEAKALDERWQNLRMETYAAMVDVMDRGIGRLLTSLDELGIADDTLVLFLSDNGGCAETPGGDNPAEVPGPVQHYAHCGPGWAWLQNTPWRRYKSHCHEGGIATPLIVRWPAAIRPGSRCEAVAHVIDLMPTLLDLAGGDYPTRHAGHETIPLEGVSLRPLLEERTREWQGHETLCWHWSGSRAVRQGDWKLVSDKLVSGKGRAAWELYDLALDRTETHDLAAVHPDRVQAMSAIWESWAVMTGVRDSTEPSAP